MPCDSQQQFSEYIIHLTKHQIKIYLCRKKNSYLHGPSTQPVSRKEIILMVIIADPVEATITSCLLNISQYHSDRHFFQGKNVYTLLLVMEKM